jgi:hypothetical protein
MTEMEKALVADLDLNLSNELPAKQPTSLRQAMAAVDDAGAAREPVQFQTKRPQSLAEQVQQVERIEREIDSRLRREMIEANNTAERLIAEAKAQYARRVAEETARLQRERDEAVRQAVDDYYAKRNDLEGLLRRRT